MSEPRPCLPPPLTFLPLRLGALLLALGLGACATKKAWQPEGVTEVCVRDANSELCGTVEQPDHVQQILESLSRATPASATQGSSRRWSHKLDIVGSTPESGRWLYSENSGEYVRLTVVESQVMRLLADDHERLKQLLPLQVQRTPVAN